MGSLLDFFSQPKLQPDFFSQPELQSDFISQLPKELSLHLLSFLGARDLLQVAKTSHHWRVLCEDDSLWRRKCREAGIKELYDLDGDVGYLNEEVPRSPWKKTFHIDHNWCHLERHPMWFLSDHVIRCLEFCGGDCFVTGLENGELKIWSTYNGMVLRTLKGHIKAVCCIRFRDNTVISGSGDSTLRVWNVDTGECLHTLTGHTGEIRCLALDGRKVVSGSWDTTLLLWDIDSGQCLQIMKGHTEPVFCVQYNTKHVVSGSLNGQVKVWDPSTGQCLHTLHTPPVGPIYSLQFNGSHIVTNWGSCPLLVWDVETGKCQLALDTLEENWAVSRYKLLRDNILYAATEDHTIEVWDINSGYRLRTHQGPKQHKLEIYYLQIMGRFLLTGSRDGSFKLWDLTSGQFIRDLLSFCQEVERLIINCSPTKLVFCTKWQIPAELMLLNFNVNKF